MGKSFLIIRLSSLGDVIHTLPMVNAIRAAIPDATIDWLIGEKGIGILENIKEINNLYLLNTKNLAQIINKKYDYILDVQGLFKTALIGKYISSSTSAKLIGFKNTREFADIFYDLKVDVGNLFDTKKHIIDLNLGLLKVAGVESENIKFLIPKISAPQNKDLLAIDFTKKTALTLPATTWESKMWGLNSWLNLIKDLSSKHQILISATSSEKELLNPLIKNLETENIDFINLIGKTNIKDLTYIIQNVDIVYGLDSGGIHLAQAIKHDEGKPDVFGIYGPTSAYRNGLYGNFENSIFKKKLDCIFCRKKKCPLKHHKCMKELTLP